MPAFQISSEAQFHQKNGGGPGRTTFATGCPIERTFKASLTPLKNLVVSKINVPIQDSK